MAMWKKYLQLLSQKANLPNPSRTLEVDNKETHNLLAPAWGQKIQVDDTQEKYISGS